MKLESARGGAVPELREKILFVSQFAEWLQGGYYILAGLWPLFHLRSFLYVTGPKTDLWLVRTSGLLIAIIGASLLASGRSTSLSKFILGIGCPLILILAEVGYVLTGALRPIYLLDAFVQFVFVVLWFSCLRNHLGVGRSVVETDRCETSQHVDGPQAMP